MSVISKVKDFFSKKQDGKRHLGRTIGFILLAIGNIVGVSAATIAWFGINNQNSRIDMVSGDLDVEINKVTAYKYVYPYYQNSTEFINYDTDGVIKKYVLEDHVSTFEGDSYDEITITDDDGTISLGTRFAGTSTTNPSLASSKNVCIPVTTPPAVYEPSFTYYLVGDGLFCGVDNSWAIEDAYAFSLKEQVTNERHAVLDNIVISAGSSFNLMQVVRVESVPTYNFFPLTGISETDSPFKIIDDDDDDIGDRILCLRSGIYKFTYSPNQLLIELHTQNAGARKDISVIKNNSFDPTKVTIDYAGGQNINKTDSEAPNYFPTLESYLSTAIYNQNTTLVLDVELNFINANPVDAILTIERTAAGANSIFNLSSKYNDTTHFKDDSTLRTSDFYNFYAIFTKTPYTDVNDDDGDTTDDLWFNLHRIGDSNSKKFHNGIISVDNPEDTTYDRKLVCPLNLKDNVNDSTVVPGIDPEGLVQNVYHCYIAIEYDYQRCNFFLDKNRLGKTYLLDRDFGFHFAGVQHVEE